MAADVVTLTTTIDDRVKARELARSAVQARLAACAQVGGPVTSVYWWRGQLEDAEEWSVTFKTTMQFAEALVAHVRATHAYDVPEILVIPVAGGNPDYLAWITEETENQAN